MLKFHGPALFNTLLDGCCAGLCSRLSLQRVPDVELRYARLRRQVDLDTQLYTLLQTRLKESQIAEAMEMANIQVVDAATVPSPSYVANPLSTCR